MRRGPSPESAEVGRAPSKQIPISNATGEVRAGRSADCGGGPGSVFGLPEMATLKDCRWYVIQTQPHAELRAISNLRRQDFYTYCPMLPKTVRHARRMLRTLYPLFPNYIFVPLNLSRDRWRSINGTRGVVRVIMQGEMPAPVPGGVVEGLLARTSAQGVVDWTVGLRAGDRVRVCEGPFAELIGTLEKLDANGRVNVLIELLGRQVAVSMGGSAVLPAA